MSKAAKSIFVFAIYMVVIGIIFMVVPNFMLSLFGFPTTTEPWIRVAGMILVIVAYYHFRAAKAELTPFFRWTVHGRSSVIVVFSIFVILGLAKPMLLLFGAVDLAAAIWTAIALRSKTS